MSKKQRPTRRRKRTAPKTTIVEFYMARLGFRPSTAVFHTTAKRECGGCRRVLPGDDFDVPVTPNRPDLNGCRRCT